MTYTVTAATDVEEMLAAYPTVAHESMRCAHPRTPLYPTSDTVRHAVATGELFVARDETGTPRGMVIAGTDGFVDWLTLSPADPFGVMEALLDHVHAVTGVPPTGGIHSEEFRSLVLRHPKMTEGGGRLVVWNRQEKRQP
jgi:hypothetical protein